MNRAFKASIAALALVPALGLAMAMPAGADNEVQINLGANNCGVQVDAGNNLLGDNGNTGSCFYAAAPDLDSYIYAETVAGPDTTKSQLFCNGAPVLGAVVTDVAGGTRTKVGPFVNPGGVCELRVTIGGGAASTSKGMGWVSWVPTP